MTIGLCKHFVHNAYAIMTTISHVNYYYMKPSVFKMIQLFSVQNVSELCNLGKYLYLASKKRNNT